MVNYRRGKVFYSILIKFQSFSWPVSWVCDCHECFCSGIASWFFHLWSPFLVAIFPICFLEALTHVALNETGRLKEAGLRGVPFLLREWYFGGYFLWIEGLWCGEDLWAYFTMDTLSLPQHSQERIFLRSLLWKSDREFLEVKARECVGIPLRLWVPGVSLITSCPSHH